MSVLTAGIKSFTLSPCVKTTVYQQMHAILLVMELPCNRVMHMVRSEQLAMASVMKWLSKQYLNLTMHAFVLNSWCMTFQLYYRELKAA